MALPIVTPVCEQRRPPLTIANFARKPCGTGPFMVVEYEPNQRIRLKRHDGYWQKGRPYLDAIEWQLAVQHLRAALQVRARRARLHARLQRGGLRALSLRARPGAGSASGSRR